MGLTYQWQVSTDSTGAVFQDLPSDSILVSGTKTSTLTFNNLTPLDNNKKYRVVIGSTDFTVPPVVSDAATLFTVPTINISTLSDIATTNTTVSFNITATANTGSIISYQWQKKTSCPAGVPDPCFINLQDVAGSISGSNTAALTLSNLTASVDNNTQYRVVVTAQCCGTTPITQPSNTATLQVAQTGQTLFITQDLSSSIISTNNTASFTIGAQASTTNSTQVPMVFTWQQLINATWTNISNTAPITNTIINSNTIVYNQTLTVSNAVAGAQYRVIVSDGRTSLTSSVGTISTPTPCTNCGGSGTGDPHFYIQGNGVTYGFDDNPLINGHKEIVMLYIKNNKDGITHLLTTKNTGSFGPGSPYSVASTTYTQLKNNTIISTVSDTKADIMGLATMTASPGRFGFTWSILDRDNISKLSDLDIVIGGAWYWMCNSLIQYIKKNPAFTKLGWPYIGFVHADGIGIGLAPYGLIREDFELDNIMIDGVSSNINGLYIAHSKDDKNNIKYNKDNSAYSIIKSNNIWQIKTRTLSPVAATRLNDTTMELRFSGYMDGESLAAGLGVGNTTAGSISGNPKISAISYDNTWYNAWNAGQKIDTGEGQENITATVTITDGQILKNDNFIFGYFVNTTNGSNTVILPNNFTDKDLFIGQQISISGALPSGTTITNINNNNNIITITVSNNCTASGRFPIELIYAISSEEIMDTPDKAKQWFQNQQPLNNILVQPSIFSQKGLGKITQDIKSNPTFWRDLSLVLSGKPLDGSPTNSIITHPKDTVAINDVATFNVSTQFSNSTYQWQKSTDGGNKWNNIEKATQATLNIRVTRADNNALFRVKVDNLLISNSAKLSYPSTLIISQNPTDQNTTNLEAVFNIVASGTLPLVYTWQKSDDNGITYKNLTNNLSSLILTNLTANDDRDLYKVLVQDGSGDAYVSAPVMLKIDPVLSVVAHPTDQIVSEEETAIFAASGSCNNGDLKYQWQISTDNGVKYANIGLLSDSATLSLSGLKIYDNNNYYRAKLISDIKQNFIYTSGAKLSVPNSIDITQQPINVLAISGNAALSITANSTQPPLTYQWQTAAPGSQIFSDISAATGSLVSVTGLTLSDDNRQYRVVLTDQRGSVYSSYALVDTTPQITIVNNLGTGYTIGNTYSLDLIILATTTDGIISYSWEKSSPDSNVFIPLTGTQFNSNSISLSFKPSDNGTRVRVKLSVPGARPLYSTASTITVPPSITVKNKLPISQTINTSDKTLTLSISAETTHPPLTYQWQKTINTITPVTYSFNNNDLFNDKIMLSLPFDGTSGYRYFIDSSKNHLRLDMYRNDSIITDPNIVLTDTNYKYGSSSAFFNDGNAHLRINDPNEILKFNNNDFTIEYWYKPIVFEDMTIISRRKYEYPIYGQAGWSLSPTTFSAKLGSVWKENWIDDSANLDTISFDEWTHIALTRYNNTYRLFRNGNLVGSFTNPDTLDETYGPLIIGTKYSNNIGWEPPYRFQGYLDNFKIMIGIAKYINNFIPDYIIDNTYNTINVGSQYMDIPQASGSTLVIDNLSQNNNLEKYRVVLTDSVSTIVVEDNK